MFVVLSKYKKGLENFQKSFKPLAVSWVCVGHFHTTRWTNRLDRQIVSDKQIFWCENRTNKFLDEQIIWYLSIWIDDFSKRICPSRQTSQQQYDIKSHQMVKWLSFPLQGNATSNRTAKNNAKCLKKLKTWSEEELTTFTHVLVSNEEQDKTQTGVAKFSYSRSLHLGAIDPLHQKFSPNRRFLRQKNLLYSTCTAWRLFCF